MNNFTSNRLVKLGLLLGALLIGAFSLIYTHNLITQLRLEEEKKIAIWAKAQEKIISAEPNEEISFYYSIVEGNKTIPVILETPDGKLIHRNLDTLKARDPNYINRKLLEMKESYPPIEVKVMDDVIGLLYYSDSYLLKQLQKYPLYQIGIISLFILVSYISFSVSRKSEQNKVWVGLAKETAHQLATPISSLIAWVELIKLDPSQATEEAMDDMKKDTDRLLIITERFSKIGSIPELTVLNVNQVLEDTLQYMRRRAPNKVKFTYTQKHKDLLVSLNSALFGWVIENLVNNAIDAMQGNGHIHFKIFQLRNQVIIDVTDNGKGIAVNKFKAIFRPGFTTKKRGWGLGLSLVKRIIEEYHSGQIGVKKSISFEETTFRISLKCESAPM